MECSEEIIRICDRYKNICPKHKLGAYISLLYYPACGTANLMRMWILAGRNKLYALQNRLEANDFAEEVAKCLSFDKQLVEEYLGIENGWFNGFGLSEHNGFTTWNCENNKYPQRISVNKGEIQIINTVREENKPFFLSAQWTKEAYEHIKVTEATIKCKNGINRLFVYGMSPAIVIERILLWKNETKLPESYLGLRERWRKY